jgi:hypothetical protein
MNNQGKSDADQADYVTQETEPVVETMSYRLFESTVLTINPDIPIKKVNGLKHWALVVYHDDMMQ